MPETNTAIELKAALDRITKLEEQIAALQQLQEHVDEWREALEQNEDKAVSATTALFDDANSWSQHFSTVRLTLTTFLVGICLGIMQFQWKEPSVIAVASAITIWILAWLLFLYYTYYEYKKIGHLNTNKTLLLKLAGADAQPDTRTRSGDVPTYVLAIVTIVFIVACCFWIPRTMDDSAASRAADQGETANAVKSVPDDDQSGGSAGDSDADTDIPLTDSQITDEETLRLPPPPPAAVHEIDEAPGSTAAVSGNTE